MGWRDVQNFMQDPMNHFGGREAREAAEEQQARQDEANEYNRGQIAQDRAYTQQATGQGRQDIGNATLRGTSAINQGSNLGQQYFAQGSNQAAGAYGQGMQGAQSQLSRLQGMGGPQAYDVQGQFGSQLGQLQQQQNQLGNVNAQAQMDPGMQFRQEQGEQALERAQAARGGRSGGRALKELMQYNQGLASQEYGAAHNRAMQAQQAGFGQQQAIAGMGLQAMTNQAGRADAMGMYGQQRQDQLGQMQAQNQMAYGSQLGSLYANTGAQQAGLAANRGSQLGQMYYGSGQAQAGLGMQGAGLMQNSTGMAIQNETNAAQYAGMVNQADANMAGQRTGAAAGVFGSIAKMSDRNVKTDIEDGHRAAEEMLDAIDPYTFRYLELAHGEGEHLGVMAQDLEQSRLGAEMVVETPDGKAIDVNKAVSALLGTVAYLHEEVARLRAMVSQGVM